MVSLSLSFTRERFRARGPEMLRDHRLGGDRRYLKLSRGSAHPEAACVIRINTRHVARCIYSLLAPRVRGSLCACMQRRARQAHNIMHRRYCAACALVTVTSSGTTFLTLARVPAALGAHTYTHAQSFSSLSFLRQHHYPFPLPIYTPVPPPFFFSLSFSQRGLGWGTNNARVRAKSASRIVVPRVVPPVVHRNYLTMINEARGNIMLRITQVTFMIKLLLLQVGVQ